MNRYHKLIVVITIIVLVGLLYYSMNNASKLHDQVDISEVESISILGKNNRMARPDEIHEIISWFNGLTNVRHNKEFAGTTSESRIFINLKDGNSIHIINSGTDFEVQRKDQSGKIISYWGKQSNIRDLLDENE